MNRLQTLFLHMIQKIYFAQMMKKRFIFKEVIFNKVVEPIMKTSRLYKVLCHFCGFEHEQISYTEDCPCCEETLLVEKNIFQTKRR